MHLKLFYVDKTVKGKFYKGGFYLFDIFFNISLIVGPMILWNLQNSYFLLASLGKKKFLKNVSNKCRSRVLNFEESFFFLIIDIWFFVKLFFIVGI